MRWMCAAAAVVLLTGCNAASFDPAVDELGSEARERAPKVTLLGCSPSEFGSLEARVRIRNTTGNRLSVFVDVHAESANGKQQFGTAHVTVDGLRPGQSTTDTGLFLEDIPKQAVCVLGEVSAF